VGRKRFNRKSQTSQKGRFFSINMNAEMFFSYFPKGDASPHSLTQDLFMQDVRNQHYEVPTEEQERQLFLDVREKRTAYEQAEGQEKDSLLSSLNEARSKVAESYIRFVIYIARKYFSDSGVAIDDLTDAGTEGLMEAVDGFDLDRGNRFTTYATDKIRVEMQNEIARNVYEGSRYFLGQRSLMLDAESQATQELGREATEEEVAARMGVNVNRLKVLKRRAEKKHVSLQQEIEHEDGEVTLFEELVPDKKAEKPEKVAQNTVLNGHLKDCMKTLTPRERRVVITRFDLDRRGVGDRTLEETGREMCVSTTRAGKLIETALPKMRPFAENMGLQMYLATELD